MGKSKILMTREKIIVEEGVYHITQRAPGRELIFLEDNDFLSFLGILKKTSSKFSIDILCFALLPNHLHILLKIRNRNLGEAMKYLFQSYAQRFNKKYQRKGHVFCGVYRASLCRDDAYLLTASLYIHLNPYKAGLLKNPFRYKWYSLHPYVNEIKDAFIKVDYILNIINDQDRENARQLYRKFIIESSDIEYKNILRDLNAPRKFLNNFVSWLRNNVEKLRWRKTYIFETYLKLEERIKEIKNTKKFGYPESRKALIYLIEQLKANGYSVKEIAERLGIGRTTIYRLKQYRFNQ
ncbi:MAG: hypothetical protein DRP68_01960 [Candidatus Omnitrophota bacterium]|nr:MAG: hypothetical protein DRP68_01960 [Candidatus Omnitrophota bacterium]RKY42131.1 MAG: hypothetical protein DRP81_07840 [Candidatus Omnitrophota bacterium]